MNYAEIQERLQRLAAQPPRDIPDGKMDRVREEIRRKTTKSAALFERAKKAVSQGVEHVLSPTDPYPLFMEKGEGSKLTDVDGNVYVDYVLGGGSVILGHNPARLNQRIADVLRRKGPLHGLCDEYEVLAAEKIAQHMPAVEKVRFFQSGTEADMAAARLVRAYTGKKKIIKFRGAYHGWADQFVTDMWVPGSGPLLASGIPPEHRVHTVLVYQNDLGELEKAFRDHRDDVAAVFVEPVGAESGSLPLMDGFHQEVRRLCDRYGALYVFDEVVTGFRLGLGGAQAYFRVEPDVTILGKIIMGGYPSCGAVAGRAEIIDTFGGATGVGWPHRLRSGDAGGQRPLHRRLLLHDGRARGERRHRQGSPHDRRAGGRAERDVRRSRHRVLRLQLRVHPSRGDGGCHGVPRRCARWPARGHAEEGLPGEVRPGPEERGYPLDLGEGIRLGGTLRRGRRRHRRRLRKGHRYARLSAIAGRNPGGGREETRA